MRDDDHTLLMAVVDKLSPIRYGPDATYDERLLAQLLHQTKEPDAWIPVALAQALRRLVLRHAARFDARVLAMAKASVHDVAVA